MSGKFCSHPFQGDAHISRHAVRKVDDLDFELVSVRAELPVPEFVHLLGQSRQRRLPTGLLLIDGTTVISTSALGKR